MEVKDRIRQLRKEAGITITKLSEELDVSRFAIMKWEQGIANPNMEAQKKLCSFFKVSGDYLMCLTDEREYSHEVSSDKFMVDLSRYSGSLTEDQKKFLLELVKKVANSNKK